MSDLPFMKLCLAGEVLDPGEEIKDHVAAWHDGAGPDLDLHEFLGMTQEEYDLYVEKGRVALNAALAARSMGTTLQKMLAIGEQGMALAARGVAHEEVLKLREWLRQRGRI